jgi:hypothetical protein
VVALFLRTGKQQGRSVNEKDVIYLVGSRALLRAYTMTAGASGNEIAYAIKVVHSEDKLDKP